MCTQVWVLMEGAAWEDIGECYYIVMAAAWEDIGERRPMAQNDFFSNRHPATSK